MLESKSLSVLVSHPRATRPVREPVRLSVVIRSRSSHYALAFKTTCIHMHDLTPRLSLSGWLSSAMRQTGAEAALTQRQPDRAPHTRPSTHRFRREKDAMPPWLQSHAPLSMLAALISSFTSRRRCPSHRPCPSLASRVPSESAPPPRRRPAQ